jgi:hypothetical protein
MSMGHWRRFSPRCPGSTPFSKNSPVLFQSNNSFPFISFILCPFRSELLFLLLFSAYLVVGFSTSLYTCSRHNHRGSVFFFFLFPFFSFFFSPSAFLFPIFLSVSVLFGIFLHLPFFPFPCVTALCSRCPCDSISLFYNSTSHPCILDSPRLILPPATQMSGLPPTTQMSGNPNDHDPSRQGDPNRQDPRDPRDTQWNNPGDQASYPVCPVSEIPSAVTFRWLRLLIAS